MTGNGSLLPAGKHNISIPEAAAPSNPPRRLQTDKLSHGEAAAVRRAVLLLETSQSDHVLKASMMIICVATPPPSQY